MLKRIAFFLLLATSQFTTPATSSLSLDDSVDIHTLTTCADMSQMTYCDNYVGVDSPSPTQAVADDPISVKNNTIIDVVENRGVKALVGYNSEYDSIFVAYRGSSNIINWINNIKMKFVYPYSFDETIGISKGFYTSYENVYDHVILSIGRVAKLYNTTNIMLTGHSLGSIATILALELTYYHSSEYNILCLVTFGSPRIGNEQFSEAVSEISWVYGPSYVSRRVVHYDDVVPHVPPKRFGYFHAETQVWFDYNNTEYVVCDDSPGHEDDSCYSSCGDNKCLNTDDHLNYMNVSMGGSGDCPQQT